MKDVTGRFYVTCNTDGPFVDSDGIDAQLYSNLADVVEDIHKYLRYFLPTNECAFGFEERFFQVTEKFSVFRVCQDCG